ncbi:MAG TPA: RNA polymerase sigma factor [Thermoanaerobaculia bacterium]|nr:RNA polymerase sigma factor [Thermoanaerobaculia bacterium]
MSAIAIDLPFAREATRGSRRPTPMDEARFEAFYRRTAGSLWSYVYRLTGDAAEADDLLQKTFYRFIRTNPVVTSEEHMRRYLYRTATNLALDHFREAKRARTRDAAVMPPHQPPDRTELRHDMMRVFGELKPRERALLWLAHVEESNHEEIGEALGLKTKSVKVLLFRARKRLGELLMKKGLAPR